MKKSIRFTGTLLALSLVLLLDGSCNKDNNISNKDTYGTIDTTTLQNQLNVLPKETLNETELSSLPLMREEEKMARDVYTAFYGKWGATIFSNISLSEQTHMDAVLMLLQKYAISDPVGTNGIGVFTNPDYQELFTTLVAQGSTSSLSAYKVGATIEEMDILDLKNYLTIVDNKDITLVYEMLAKGSRNHLRSFYKNILNLGGTYTPQYLTQEEFDAIVNSSMETGF